MKTLMIQLLESLRERVTQNLVTIRQNEAEIRKLLKEPLSNQRTHNLNNRYELSKKILEENRDNLDMQNKMVSFINKHKEIPEYSSDLQSLSNFENSVKKMQQENDEQKKQNQTKPIVDKTPSNQTTDESKNTADEKQETDNSINTDLAESIFSLTASGKLAYNKQHPFYTDDDFFENLLSYHTQREEYEICALLMKTRKE